MSAVLQWFAADGTTGTGQGALGVVAPGASMSSPYLLVCKNTGDADAENVKILITQVGNLDLEGWLSLSVQEADDTGAPLGSPVTGDADDPPTFASLPAGHALNVSVSASVPGGATLSSEALLALLEAEW